MLNKTIMKGQLVSKNEKTIILQTKDGQGAIPVEEVYDVKVREISLLKTAGLIGLIPVAVYAGLIIVVIIVGGM